LDEGSVAIAVGTSSFTLPAADVDIVDALLMADTGSYLKIKGIAGMLDVTAHPFNSKLDTKAMATILTEEAGIILDVNAAGAVISLGASSWNSGDITYRDEDGVYDDPTLWTFVGNVTYPVPDLVTIDAGFGLKQGAPCVVDPDTGANSVKKEDAISDMGLAAKADVKAVPNLSLAPAIGVRMLTEPDPDDLEKTITATGIKFDLPVSYSMDALTAKVGFTFTDYTFLTECGDPQNDAYDESTAELKVTLGGSYALSDMGVTPKLDVTVYPGVAARKVKATELWQVDPHDDNDDYGAWDNDTADATGSKGQTLEKDTEPGLAFKVEPAVDVKVSDDITITPKFIYKSDSNFPEDYELDAAGDTIVTGVQKGTQVGFEIKLAASF
jgi:hypothetical protein